MKPEQQFYHTYIRPALLATHYQRIESIAGRGIPDLNVGFCGVEFWIELKVEVRGKIYLRVQQLAWGKLRASKDGHVFVVARTSNGVGIWKFPDISVTYIPKYGIINNAPKILLDMRSVKSRLLECLCSLLE